MWLFWFSHPLIKTQCNLLMDGATSTTNLFIAQWIELVWMIYKVITNLYTYNISNPL